MKLRQIVFTLLMFLFVGGLNIDILAEEEMGQTETSTEQQEPTVEPEQPSDIENPEDIEPEEEVQPYTGWDETQSIYYIDDVAVDGVQKIDEDYYLFSDSSLNQTFTGFVQDQMDGNWYFLENGKSNWNFTGLGKNSSDGKMSFSRNGILDLSFTGVAKSIVDGKWYHAKNGIIDYGFTGFSKSIENGRWYFSRKGVLDWSFTGVAKSIENGRWYHAKKGALDWNFTGVSKSVENGRWYHSKNGRLDWGFTGVSKSIENGKWYFSRKGALDWNFTGAAISVANGKWYTVKKGSLNWSYNGDMKCLDGQTRYFKKGAHDVNYHALIGVGNIIKVYQSGIRKKDITINSQKDPRWAHLWAAVGCGPSSIATAINIVHNNNNQTTATLAPMFKKAGLMPYGMTPGNKETLDYIKKTFNVKATDCSNKNTLINELKKGRPVIMVTATDYSGNPMNSAYAPINHVQLALSYNPSTQRITYAEPLGGKNGTVPYVKTVNIHDLYAYYQGTSTGGIHFFSLWK